MTEELLRADTQAEALAWLAEYGGDAKALAGGTAVVLLLQQRLIAPAVLVDIGRLSGLAFIRLEADGLHLGPLTTLRAIERSGAVRVHFPALATACASVGNVRIRNQATIGGCLAEADYASDPPAVLLALEAEVRLERVDGARSLPFKDFLLGFYATALEPDELITDIRVPLSVGLRSSYLKFKTRSSEDRPCLGVAVAARLEDGRCLDLRVAIGAAAEAPVRLPEVEGWARGQTLDEGLASEIADRYATGVETIDDLRASAWYRKQMIRVFVRRALEEIGRGHR